MTRVFADSAYYVALLNRRDALHQRAARLLPQLRENGPVHLVTTDTVLVEVLTYVSRFGARSRANAVEFVRACQSDDATMIIAQTPELFAAGLRVYAARLDKAYSMIDCISMALCRREGIHDVLTHDHDFEQEGFRILL